MAKQPPNPELMEQAKKAMKEMADKGRRYQANIDCDLDELPAGPDFGPRNDIEYRKLINDIRELDANDE